MPEDPSEVPVGTATERIIKGSPHYTCGELFEFYEWPHSGIGVPWRAAPKELSELLAERWDIFAVYDRATVLMRERIDEPEPEPTRIVEDFPAAALPDDAADAYEQMKLVLMRHRAEGWDQLGVDQAKKMLSCLATYCYREGLR
jgi:hypothetical protein